ncbi:hypothetical protein [Streptomyces lonarensis]|uniref:hypothetical protein n=1 Tax=Streptomyces lonarensis TaxID=700599 RepID=UPI001ADDAA5A|nr:hypothetical protein [Streptomyces lonarensis]
MLRNVLGAVLAVLGAAIALVSPFRDWYAGRAGRDFRLQELFSSGGITDTRADLFAGIFLVMLAVAVLTVLGVVLRSRLLVALAGVVALGITVLWMVRQYQVADTLVVGGDGMQWGAVGALVGGALLLIGSALMAGRHPAVAHGRHRHDGRGRGHRPVAGGEDDRYEDRYDDRYADEPDRPVDPSYDHYPRASHDPYAPGRPVDPADPRYDPHHNRPPDPGPPAAPPPGRGQAGADDETVVDGPWHTGRRGSWGDARRREDDEGHHGGRDAA